MKDYPASSLANFLNNHGLLNLFRGPQWFSIKGGSNQYIEKIIEKGNLNNIFLDSKVAIKRVKNKIILENNGEKREYDKLIMACNAKEIIGSILDLGKNEISILCYVELVEPMGADTLVWTSIEGRPISIRLEGSSNYNLNDEINISFDINKSSLFDSKSEERI